MFYFRLGSRKSVSVDVACLCLPKNILTALRTHRFAEVRAFLLPFILCVTESYNDLCVLEHLCTGTTVRICGCAFLYSAHEGPSKHYVSMKVQLSSCNP